MKISKAVFVKSYADAEKFALEESGMTEICVAGRSNVGKSSFINMLCQNGKLCKTSSLPGRTRLINIFGINDEFLLVDLPGYGFAKASKQERKSWADLMGGYFGEAKFLRHALVLMDIRHEPTALDVQMLEYLYYYQIPFTVIATKSDKLSKSKVSQNVTAMAAALKIGRDNIIPVSVEGFNRDRVLSKLEEILEVGEDIEQVCQEEDN